MRLHELIKLGVPAKLKYGEVHKYKWNGANLLRLPHNEIACAEYFSICSDAWQLDEPTVEDVLKERGYRFFASNIRGVWVGTEKDGCLLILDSKPTSAAEMTRIIDFLESLTPQKPGG